MWYSSQTASGTGNFARRSLMPISVSTSRMLYFLKASHLSGAWKGWFLVRPPFAFVGAQGTEKYLIRSFPSVSFCFSRPRTAPTPSRESGSPIVAAQTIEQRQLTGFKKRAHSVERGWLSWKGSRLTPRSRRYRDKHTRSKFALKAHLMTVSSVRASIISCGRRSPCARSMTVTSEPSAL